MIVNDKFKEMKLIPLLNNGKIPKIKWGTDDILPFNGDETGYGIDTGRSGLLVIDCDNKHDEINGVNTFIELCEKNGGIPETLTVETPNNGLHFYFKANGLKIKNSASTILGDGVDVRGLGGYIIGPGSMVKDENGIIKEYTIEDSNLDILDLPKWLESILLKETKTIKNEANKLVKKNNSNEKSDSNDDSKILDNKHAVDWAVDKMINAQSGTRNETLNLTSYFMGRKRVPQNQARRLVDIAVNNGLDNESANKTFESGYEKGASEEPLELTVISKEYNKSTGTSFKEDPTDSEFYTHVAVAYNFWKNNSEKLIYWQHDSSWYGYDEIDHCWKKQDEDYIKTKVKDFFEFFIPDIRSKHTRLSVSIYKAQERMWTKSFVDSVAAMSKLEFYNSNSRLFDSNPYLINCKNGTYDITTDQLLPHNYKDYITKYIPIDYEKNFIDKYTNMIIESVKEDQREYLQLIAGQSLTGFQPISQCIFFFNGKGSNGKTTYIDLLVNTSGTYGSLQSPDILLPANGKEIYAMANFEGLRTAIVEELPDSKQLNSGALKRIVGTRQINARQIYGKNRTFDNISTIFVSCNRLPLVTEFDHGTWRRLSVFSFPYTYRRTKNQIKNKFDKLGDPNVLYAASHREETLKAGLAWRIEGARKWYLDKSLENTAKPESMINTENEWRENSDLIYGFLTETVKNNQESFILLQDIFDSFNQWLLERGNSKVSMRYFVEALQNHEYFTDNKLVYKKNTYVSKELKHSEWFDPTDKQKMPRSLGYKNSYIIGIEFK